MSQELYQGRIATVREAQNFQRNFAPIIAQVLNAAPAEVSMGVKKCCKKKRSKTDVLLAPTELNVIQVDFEEHKCVAQQQKQPADVQLKVAALSTLVASQDNLIISEPSVITQRIQRIVAAPTVKETHKEIKAAFKAIKADHRQSFVSNVETAVKESAIAVGFKEIQVAEQTSDLVRIVGTNSTGQNLVAEIDVQEQIDIRTELIGYTDGGCKDVMRAFDDEMVKRGITAHQKEQKATNGVPQMPFAKKLAKKRSVRSFADEQTIVETEHSRITIKR